MVPERDDWQSIKQVSDFDHIKFLLLFHKSNFGNE